MLVQYPLEDRQMLHQCSHCSVVEQQLVHDHFGDAAGIVEVDRAAEKARPSSHPLLRRLDPRSCRELRRHEVDVFNIWMSFDDVKQVFGGLDPPCLKVVLLDGVLAGNPPEIIDAVNGAVHGIKLCVKPAMYQSRFEMVIEKLGAEALKHRSGPDQPDADNQSMNVLDAFSLTHGCSPSLGAGEHIGDEVRSSGVDTHDRRGDHRIGFAAKAG